ncbi:hypothetical protein OROMI_019506 [Orobanche minor]
MKLKWYHSPFQRVSTIVHSNTFPLKEQTTIASERGRPNVEESCNRNLRDFDGLHNTLSRTLQPQQRIPQAKPGKVVGPVLPYENGLAMKDSYDPTTRVRNTVIPSSYSYHRNHDLERSVGSEITRREFSSATKQIRNSGLAAKLAPDMRINIDTAPFYTLTQAGGPKLDSAEDRVVMIDTNLLQAKAQFGGHGVVGASAATGVGAAHRKVATVQYGMARMY